VVRLAANARNLKGRGGVRLSLNGQNQAKRKRGGNY
jgi:hypothetical protein